MFRLTLLFLLLFPTPVLAGHYYAVPSVGASCDFCTGDLLFSWHVEGVSAAAALTVTNGTPPACGCSVGDTVVSLDSGATIETAPVAWSGYSLKINGAYDNGVIDVTGGELDTGTGTIVFDIYITTWVDGARLLMSEGQANEDYIKVEMVAGDELQFRREGANAGTESTTTSGADLATSIAYTVTLKYRLGSSNPSMSVNVNSVTDTIDTDLTAMDTAPTTLAWGNWGSSNGAVFDMKNMKIYDAWQ